MELTGHRYLLHSYVIVVNVPSILVFLYDPSSCPRIIINVMEWDLVVRATLGDNKGRGVGGGVPESQQAHIKYNSDCGSVHSCPRAACSSQSAVRFYKII